LRPPKPRRNLGQDGVAGVVVMRVAARSFDIRRSGQRAVLLRALAVLAIAMAILLPMID
jgi:hypothetical protein